MFSKKQSKKESPPVPYSDPWEVVRVGKHGHTGHRCFLPVWNVNDDPVQLGKGSIIRCRECMTLYRCFGVGEYGMGWTRLRGWRLAKFAKSEEGREEVGFHVV